MREIVTLVALHGSIGCRMLSAVVYDQQKVGWGNNKRPRSFVYGNVRTTTKNHLDGKDDAAIM